MIKAVLFDVGGVIISSLDRLIDDDIKKTLGFSEKQFNNLWGKHIDKFVSGRVGEKEFWKLIIKEIGRSLSLPNESLFLREYCKNLVIDQQIIGLVLKLKFNRYVVGVISNSIYPQSQYNKKIGLYDLFDHVVLSDEVGMFKPNKEIYLHTLNRLKLNPDNIIFIDDKIENVRTANQVGMKGLRYFSYRKLEKDLLGFKVSLDWEEKK